MTLTQAEKDRYEWQMWTPGFGQAGQEKLRASSVLVSRVGGLGGPVAYELAAAGVGKLVLAHGGNVKASDLNRQLLVTTDSIGKPRVPVAAKRLRELNPEVEVVAHPENISDANAQELIASVDLVVDCAPLFEERYAMNKAAVVLGKPLVECAMYDTDATLTTIVPGSTPCLACLFPEKPPHWKREFPVFGAVSGSVGCMAAMEAIKVLTGLGTPLTNRLLSYDLRRMQFRTLKIARRPDCAVCAAS